ncbi:hypothetical protein [Desulfitobacterium dichloroeliminans]|uniref:hypothetical protein n=1 Tax=Desulfitobacterium dichloroeliminans TaxID=233055 RepID=UPI001FA6F72A|nr:hypothetical protein [Desulfitobacterium dichloroeliminans]
MIEGLSNCAASFGKNRGDCGGSGGFTMVNVTDGSNVNVGFITFVFLLCHFEFSLLLIIEYFFIWARLSIFS